MPITALPTDAVSLVLVRLGRALDIARTAPTCRALRDAARVAEQAHRRVCFEHDEGVYCVATAPDGRIITGSEDMTVRVWRNGACESTSSDVASVGTLSSEVHSP